MASTSANRNCPKADKVGALIDAVCGRMSRELARDVSSRHGISLPGARLLGLLSGARHMRCSALAATLGLDAPTLSHLLRALADRDLIERERSRKDNRAVKVRLTDEGAAVATSFIDIEERWQRTMFDGIDDAERARLADLLTRMNDNLAEANAPAPAGAAATRRIAAPASA